MEEVRNDARRLDHFRAYVARPPRARAAEGDGGMKRVRLILTRVDDLEMLTIKHPLFIGICSDRFIIDDQRGPLKAKPAPPAIEPSEGE
jgi:hypothetical protein